MAHAIERIQENGVDVDCFSYVGAKPWHDLGQRLGEQGDMTIRAKDMEKAARADWGVFTEEVCTVSDHQLIKGVKAILRDRDRRALGFTTSKYKEIQHRVLGDLADFLVEEGKASWETCGVLNDGQRIFYTVRLKVKLEALKNDEMDLFVALTTSHDGSSVVDLLLTGVRIVCNNTLTLAMSQNVDSVKIRHTGDVDKAIEAARKAIVNLDKNIENLDEGMTALTTIVMSEKQANKFLDKVAPVPKLPDVETFKLFGEDKQKRVLYEQDLAMRVQARIRELHETGEGHELRGVKGTGYGWLNAVTNYATHEMKSKSKIESNMVGDASKMGRRAYTLLTTKESRDEILLAA